MMTKKLIYGASFFLFIVIGKGTSCQNISDTYSLSAFIADSINYSKIERVKCKWEIYTIAFRLNKKGELSQMRFSDSIPDEFKDELTRLLKLTNGKWDRKFLKKTSTKSVFVQPVINELISNCVDRPFKVFYSGIDSSLDNELSIYKSISITAIANSISLSESFERFMQINSKSFQFVKCILLPTCRIKDKKVKRYRQE